MTNNKSIVVILFIGLFVFATCEKETELIIPKPENKLVVNSILEANKPLKVYVGESTYSLDSNIRHINNAIVNITDNNSNILYSLSYIKDGMYVNDNVLCKENTSYSIEVITSKYLKATSTCFVPKSVSFSEYSFTKEAGINKEGFPNKLLTVSIFDNSNNENFYMLLLEWHSLDSIPFQGYVFNNSWYSYSPVIMAEGDENEHVFSDILFNGETVVIPMNFHVWDYDIHYDLSYKLKCYLITISKEYYNYHKSYMNLLESDNNIWQANSPPQLYSNIDNALGVFGGINLSDSITIDF